MLSQLIMSNRWNYTSHVFLPETDLWLTLVALASWILVPFSCAHDVTCLLHQEGCVSLCIHHNEGMLSWLLSVLPRIQFEVGVCHPCSWTIVIWSMTTMEHMRGFRCGVSDVGFSFKNTARATIPWSCHFLQRSVFFATWGNGRWRPVEDFGFSCRFGCRWGGRRVWLSCHVSPDVSWRQPDVR